MNAQSLRADQFETLQSLIGDQHLPALPCIFIYGQHSCGKMTVLRRVLHNKELDHVVVNCVECFINTSLFEQILTGLDPTFKQRSDNVNDFVRNLKSLLKKKNLPVYVVIDQAEHLRRNIIFSKLVKLQELTSCNVGVVLVSSLPWEKFSDVAPFSSPITIFFPSYTKGELSELLMDACPPDADVEVYRDYTTMLLGVFSSACRDLRELRHVANVNFRFYLAPIEDESVSRDDRRKLWRAIEPRFYRALQQLYLREDDGSHPVLPPDLPFYTKYLLIASYIASYNPATSDRRYFVKRAGRMKKSLRDLKQGERKKRHLLGPRAFPLDRLMAIFYSIVDGRVPPAAALFSQISTLTSFHLLTRSSHSDQIDSPRFKCLAPLTLVTTVARSVDFDVIRYLYDFV